MSYGQIPFGMREIVIRDEAGADPVALPKAILMAVSERIESAEFVAEGTVVDAVAFTSACDWELESGGISLEAWAKLTGRTATEFITSPPNRQKRIIIRGDSFPYLQIWGRSVGDGADDIYIKLHRCKLTGIEGTLRQREFFITSCAGVAVPDTNGDIYTVTQRETGVPL